MRVTCVITRRVQVTVWSGATLHGDGRQVTRQVGDQHCSPPARLEERGLSSCINERMELSSSSGGKYGHGLGYITTATG